MKLRRHGVLRVASAAGLACALLVLFRTAPGQAAAGFRLATFNVQALSARDSEARFALIARALSAAGFPDVVALQEIADDDGAIDAGRTSAGATLRRLVDAIATAGGPPYAAFQFDPEDGREGGPPGANIRNVWLTTLPLRRQPLAVAHNPDQLAKHDPGFGHTRPPLAVELDVNGQALLLVNVHLSAGARADKRSVQARALADAVNAAPSHVAKAIVGDFNADDGEAVYQQLGAAGLLDADSQEAAPTHTSGARFDRIYHGAEMRPLATGVVRVPTASDHHLLWADFAVADAASPASPAGGCELAARGARLPPSGVVLLGLGLIVHGGWRLWKRPLMWEDEPPLTHATRPVCRKAQS